MCHICAKILFIYLFTKADPDKFLSKSLQKIKIFFFLNAISSYTFVYLQFFVNKSLSGARKFDGFYRSIIFVQIEIQKKNSFTN